MRGFAIVLSVLIGGCASSTLATQHHNNARTGWDNDGMLTTSNVKTNFGKLFSLPVDGDMYAQPLWIEAVKIANQGTHNVIFVATAQNTVYAFDADAAGAPLWKHAFGNYLPGPPNPDGTWLFSFGTDVGIISTPVIDITRGVLYVVTKTVVQGAYASTLHALDITSGNEVVQAATIGGSVPNTNPQMKGQMITFSAREAVNRAGLLLSNGVVYIAFANPGDYGSWYGWVFAHDAKTLQRIAIFNDETSDRSAGIWQSGQGLAADNGGAVYFFTGNGDYNPANGDYGDSIIKLVFNGNSLTVSNHFNPGNNGFLNANDLDLASAGPILFPASNFLVGGGKEGIIYVIDTSTMTLVQKFQATAINNANVHIQSAHIHGSPVYWGGPVGKNPFIYVWGENDFLKQFKYDSNNVQTPFSFFSQSTMMVPEGMPGGILTVSGGSATGDGIVWATHPCQWDAQKQACMQCPALACPLANFTGLPQQNCNPRHCTTDGETFTVPGILRAFDARDVKTELWNSNLNLQRDVVGDFAKFCPPTIANGKVYVATFRDQYDAQNPSKVRINALQVYGLLR